MVGILTLWGGVLGANARGVDKAIRAALFRSGASKPALMSIEG